MEVEIVNNKVELKSSEPRQIYEFCKLVTPQFYRDKTIEDIKREITSIDILTRNIPFNILSKMCELAVKYYPRDKAKDVKLVFDINYIMTKYVPAEYLIRNNLGSFEELYTDLDKVEL